MATDTLYDLLGVTADASAGDIRSAYRRLSKVYHPDLGGTAAYFRRLQEAYEVLTDPSRRSAYDRLLQTTVGPVAPRGPAGGSPHQRASTSGSANGGVPPRQSNYVKVPQNRSPAGAPGHSAPRAASRYRRLQAKWLPGSDPRPGGVRRHQEVTTAAWITSVIVVGVIVGTLLAATHGIILILLVVMGVVAWRRRRLLQRKAQLRHRADMAAAEINRTAREAAQRRRAAHAASSDERADRVPFAGERVRQRTPGEKSVFERRE